MVRSFHALRFSAWQREKPHDLGWYIKGAYHGQKRH
ncbi:MAG: hypothetical protein [Siphoviridae sp. ct7UA22]|nr:MAG: hypothetical protein [Siphoviridae sp. ct7UA22]